MILSVSRLRTYLACGRQYRFRYIEKAEPEFLSINLVFGSAMHYAISEFHQSKNNLDAGQAHNLFLRYFTAEIADAKRQNQPIRFGFAEADILTEQAQTLCRLYVEQFARRKAEDVELLFEIPLLDPYSGVGDSNHTLVGRIDLVAEGGLIELKTSSRSPSQSDIDRNIQLTAYALAFSYLYGCLPESLDVVTLTKTKTPKIDVKSTSRTADDFRLFCEMACEVAAAIDKSAFPRNLEHQWGCGNCEYRNRCLGAQF